MKKVNIGHLMIAVLLVYIPFHLFEESLGNFPAWMQQHHWMSEKLTYGHWMAGNIFFYFPLLITGVLLYFLFGERLLFTGIAVIIWGLLNSLEHVIYTLVDFKVSPGLFSSILFFMIAVLSYYKLKRLAKFNLRIIVPSIILALLYALLPVALQIIFSPIFRTIFI